MKLPLVKCLKMCKVETNAVRSLLAVVYNSYCTFNLKACIGFIAIISMNYQPSAKL